MRFAITLAGAIAFTLCAVSCDNVQGGGGNYTGTWTGSASFTDNSANPRCNWIGRQANPPAVTLVFNESGDNVTGTVTINIPAQFAQDLDPGDGFECNDPNFPLAGGPRAIVFVELTPANRLTFRDQFATPGNTWVVTRTTDTIDGNVSNPDAPLGTGLRTITSLSLGRQ